jgi:hypothetical protein
MTPGVGITIAGTAPLARKRDGATTAGTITPSGRANPAAIGCTRETAGTEEEGEKSPMPATSAPVVTGIIAAGLVARGEGVECQNITESACMGNMDDTASTGESTLEEATAVAGTPRPVEITAGVKTAPRRTGEPGITDARMTGPRHIVVSD